MPSVLLVKTSSMGDLVHTLPAVSDLARARPDMQIDWVAEESFTAIPALHPAVRRVLPIALRRWRRSWSDPAVRVQIRDFLGNLRAQRYDWVIDCQGLLKSALVAWAARGETVGYDWHSAREPVSSLWYARKIKVGRSLAAIERNRRLVGSVFDLDVSTAPQFGAQALPLQADWLPKQPYAVLMPSASRAQKLWPEAHWIAMSASLAQAGLASVIVWGNAQEKARAERLAQGMAQAQVSAPLALHQAAALLAGCRAAVGLDSGLTHLAAALGKPTVGIFCDHSTALTPVTGPAYCASLGGKGTPPSLDSVCQAVREMLDTLDRRVARMPAIDDL